MTSEHIVTWDIGYQFCFLSYFLMGYKLRKWSENRKNNVLAYFLIIGGFIVNIGLGCINYLRGLRGFPVDVAQFKLNPFSYGPLAPIEILASCLIFAGFSVLKVKKDCSKLAKYTFLIYLFHAGILDVVFKIAGNVLKNTTSIEIILVITLSIIAFLISLFASVICSKVLRKIVTKGYIDGIL